jgi:hypothetical protein
MPASLWHDPGTWIALGISALFLVVAWGMHRAITRVLKTPPIDLTLAASATTTKDPSHEQ